MNFIREPYFRTTAGTPYPLEDTHKGSSIFLTSSGPSLTEEVITKLDQPGIVRFGLNNSPAKLRPHFWTCVDEPSRFLKSIWLDSSIQKFVYHEHLNAPLWDSTNNCVLNKIVPCTCPNIVVYNRNKDIQLDKWLTEPSFCWGINDKSEFIDPITGTAFRGGRSVMLVAMKIMMVLGFKNIYLTGCDFNMQPDKPYAFDQGKHPDACKSNNKMYEFLNVVFTNLQPYFLDAGLNVYNCTPNSGLTAFPYKDLDEAIKDAKGVHLNNIGEEPTANQYRKFKAKLYPENDKTRQIDTILEDLRDKPEDMQKVVLAGDASQVRERLRRLHETLDRAGASDKKTFEDIKAKAEQEIFKEAPLAPPKLLNIAQTFGLNVTVTKSEQIETVQQELKKVAKPEKFVLAVTHYNRFDYLKRLFDSWKSTFYRDVDWEVIIADDGSDTEVCSQIKELQRELSDGGIFTSVYYSNRQGVHHGTNQIIKHLQNIDFDMCFKVDDDVKFLQAGWDINYYRAAKVTGYDHLVFSKTPSIEPINTAFNPYIRAKGSVNKAFGCFFTITPEIVNKVGFFDTRNFGLCLFGHWDYSNRCIRAGFNETLCYDLKDSNNYIHVDNRWNAPEEYIEAVPNNWRYEIEGRGKRAAIKRNKLRDSSRIYVPYTEIPRTFDKPEACDLPFYIKQDKNYGLGNFINCTGVIKKLYTIYNQPIPVYFETAFIKELFEDWKCIDVCEEEPISQCLFTSGLSGSPTRCNGTEWASNYRKIIWNNYKLMDDVIPPVMPETSPMTTAEDYCVIARGCMDGSRWAEHKEVGDDIYKYIIDKIDMPIMFVGSSTDKERWFKNMKSWNKNVNILIDDPNAILSCIKGCKYFIANDTGWTHAANACNKDTFVIWKDTPLLKNRGANNNATYSLKGNWEADFDKWIDKH